MSIQEIRDIFKGLYRDSDTYLAVIIILVAIIAFGLGRLSVEPNQANQGVVPISESEAEALHATEPHISSTTDAIVGGYVASKTGTKYHLPWCAGAQKIKEENKIWFATKAEAETAGYTPAANCKGI